MKRKATMVLVVKEKKVKYRSGVLGECVVSRGVAEYYKN